MTSKKVPKTCDFCGNDIVTEMKYKLQVSQRGGIKGQFVKSNSEADMCHNCFLAICKNGYEPKWVTLKKNETTGKWDEVDPQETLVS